MTITREDSIVTQVAAKIAGDITTSTAGGATLEEALTNFTVAFSYVKDALFDAHVGNATSMVQAAFAGTTVETVPARSQTVTPNAPGTLKIAGTQHGELPVWLAAACAKDGVTEVWDNRDKAVGTNRPWFKQAGQGVQSSEAKGYWPPKGS